MAILTITGDIRISTGKRLWRASDSMESAEKELGLIFNGDEIFDYNSSMDLLIYSKDEVVS